MIKKQNSGNRIFIISASFIYLLLLIAIVFFVPPRERKSKTYEYHFIPLENTLAQIHDPAQYNTPDYWYMFTVSICGNVLLFIPFGFLSGFLFPEKSKLTLYWYALSVSIIIELTQLIFHLGVCDIDDVILNSIGAVIGILISFLLKHLIALKLNKLTYP